ncbi:hypothetical protein Ciccas_003207 [Cichlidogyrus casuarinus]|uniref:Rhodanese domain-containing protein n=1 Tax=Cichlidogyrus casuarinus TaxID=1844966 RepID=A0ABD2QIB8_9PLAT
MIFRCMQKVLRAVAPIGHRTVLIKSPLSIQPAVYPNIQPRFYHKSDDIKVDPWIPKTALDTSTFKLMLDSIPVQLFDVRSTEDHGKTGSINNATNIPLADLKVALHLNPPDFKLKYNIEKPKASDDNLVFYGSKDVSGIAACEIAHKAGFKKSKYYQDGWEGWNKPSQ